MSHYSAVKLIIKNRACLIKALEDLGFKDKLEIHDVPKALYGYGGDARPQKANVIIRRNNVGGAANDIGFVLREDGTYEAIISDYDSGNSAALKNDLCRKNKAGAIQGYDQNWTNLLQQRYALHVVEETARLENYYETEITQDEEGNVYVELEIRD